MIVAADLQRCASPACGVGFYVASFLPWRVRGYCSPACDPATYPTGEAWGASKLSEEALALEHARAWWARYGSTP